METQYYYQGHWGGPRDITLPIGTHGLWNSCAVFDGARSIQRQLPDLLAHCQRIVAAAPSMLLKSPLTPEEIAEIAIEGVHRFPADAELYITPLLFAVGGGLVPDADSTQLMIDIHLDPLVREGFAACTDIETIRPAAHSMQTAYKTSWLYANAIPARTEARARGFADAVMRDHDDNVVEFSTANLWLVKNGEIITPEENGTFLPGVTRRRVLSVLSDANIPVTQRTVSLDDLKTADEIFSTGNANQIRPLTKLDEREFTPGPVFEKVKSLYWDYVATTRIE